MSDVYYKKKQPSCTLPDGTEWFAGAAGDSCTSRVCTQVPIVAKNPTVTNSEYIEREAVLKRLKLTDMDKSTEFCAGVQFGIEHAIDVVKEASAADVVLVCRCEDCKHTREKTAYEAAYLIPECLICEHPEVSEDGWAAVKPEHFCSYGERKHDSVETI